jgi:hypothetical protein
MTLRAGDTFQGMRIDRIDGRWTQLGYPKGHPNRSYAEEYNRENEAKGESYRMRMPVFLIPTPNKNGAPAATDVVGRFIAGMGGVSGNFQTDGRKIWSYGRHWTMAHVVDVDRDGNATAVMFDDKMFGPPYSPTTSTHMDALRRDPRLEPLVINRDQFPDALIDGMAQAMAAKAVGHANVADFESAFHQVVGRQAPEVAVREAFVRARRIVRMGGAAEYQHSRKSKRRNEMYTSDSLDAMIDWARGYGERYTQLLDEYEKRVFKPYGEKMSPIPVRGMPRRPQLVSKPIAPPTEKDRAKGVLAWHFLRGDGFLRHEVEPRKVEVGKTISMRIDADHPKIVACSYGLHGSVRMNNAYGYYSGAILTRTLHYGKIDKQDDKLASQHRECLGMIDMESEVGEQIRILLTYDSTRSAESLALAALGMTATQRTPSEHTDLVTTLPEGASSALDEKSESDYDGVPF